MFRIDEEAFLLTHVFVLQGNEPSRGAAPKRPAKPVVARAEARGQYDNEYNLTPEQLDSLDPRIREWVTNPNYTVASVERSTAEESRAASSAATGRHSEPPKAKNPLGAARRSADGVLTIREGKKKEDEPPIPELQMLARLGMHMPLRYKDKFRSFWPATVPRTNAKRIEVDPIETYKLLQHYQMRLNQSSFRASQAQDALFSKISSAEHNLWSCAERTAATGLALNKLETHASEAWNIQNQLEQTRMKLAGVVQSIDRLLMQLPPDLVEYLGRPTFHIAQRFTNSYYLKLNYWSLTPYPAETQDQKELEIEWITRILPYWETAIKSPKAKTLWRQGIPPRLRAYIWQNAIGNQLFLTREMYHEHIQKYSETLKNGIGTTSKPSLNQSAASLDDTVGVDLGDGLSASMDEIRVRDVHSNLNPSQAGNDAESSKIGADGATAEDSKVKTENSSSAPQSRDAETKATQTNTSTSKESKSYPGNPEEHAPGSPARMKRMHELVLRDSPRTFSKLGIYRTSGTVPHDTLVSVLHAVATTRPDLAYVQGQSFIAAALLLYMPADEAYVTLANLLERHFFKTFFLHHDMASVKVHTEHFSAILEKNLPELAAHFQSLKLVPELYLFDWYVTLFSKPLPPPISGIIWDCYFLEGPNFIPLFSCAILKHYQSRLILFNFEECMKLLQQLPDEFDVLQVLTEVDKLPSARPPAPATRRASIARMTPISNSSAQTSSPSSLNTSTPQ